jgi:uncharacterized protein YraI
MRALGRYLTSRMHLVMLRCSNERIVDTMNQERSFIGIRAAVASITVALLATAAAAGDRTMTAADVNLRTGGGVEHERITTLQRGTEVAIEECRDGWCRVAALDVSGWVSARYLVAAVGGGTGVVEPYDPPIVRAPPVEAFDIVGPRDAHELGYSRHHRLNRSFHETRR